MSTFGARKCLSMSTPKSSFRSVRYYHSIAFADCGQSRAEMIRVKRREVFETKILNLFNSFDDALRGMRRSAIMRKLRASQAPDELERAEAKELFETYLNRYWDLNVALYDFALCFEPVKRANEHCEYRPIERKQ